VSGEVLAGYLAPKDLRQLRIWMQPRREALVEAFLAALHHEEPGTMRARYKEATRDI
jgi:hypothetical protein